MFAYRWPIVLCLRENINFFRPEHLPKCKDLSITFWLPGLDEAMANSAVAMRKKCGKCATHCYLYIKQKLMLIWRLSAMLGWIRPDAAMPNVIRILGFRRSLDVAFVLQKRQY